MAADAIDLLKDCQLFVKQVNPRQYVAQILQLYQSQVPLTMADKDDAATRGNDWEVVSHTAFAYAAAPGPKPLDLKDHDKEVTPYEPETSHPLYMSRHFVFPPTELQNIASEPGTKLTEASKKMDSGFSLEQETVSHGKEEGDLTLKGLDLSNDFGALEDLSFSRRKAKTKKTFTRQQSVQDI